MQGRGPGGEGATAARPNWMEEVTLKIQQKAEGVYQSIPPYFRRFDALGNEEHPSIFKPRHKPNRHHVAVAPMPMALDQFTSPAQAAAQPTQPPLDRTGREPAQLQAPRASATDRDVIVAAVGPYHHHSAYAQPQPPLITHAKKCAIVMFLAREEFRLDTVGFLGWARDNEARARGCYERDSVTMGSEEFAEMLLLDGCLLLFAVFLLRSSVCEDQRPAELARCGEHGKEFIYLSADMSLHMKQTRLDLLMLDNQIPFFVLAALHNRIKDTFFRGINRSIQELALSCFDDIHPIGFKGDGDWNANNRFPRTVHHLLHLFHWSRVPRGKHTVDISSYLPKEPESHLPCATELGESLTTFSKQSAPGSGSLDIDFQSKMLGVRGVMRIPALYIHEYSESVFRSLITFEQSHLRCGLGVTAYSICMARLLQSEDDAKLLRKSGILAHTHKTDQEIVHLFRGLGDECSNTFYSKDMLALCKDVAAHHQNTAPRVVKGVVLQCFPRQTVTFFVILAAVISIATLVNTIYAIYRYYHPLK